MTKYNEWKRTTELKPYLTWIQWNGTVCKVTGVRLLEADHEHAGKYMVSLARYNMSGMQLGTPELIATAGACWMIIETPSAYGVK